MPKQSWNVCLWGKIRSDWRRVKTALLVESRCGAVRQVKHICCRPFRLAVRQWFHHGSVSTPTGSPEAVARLRLPQNVACGFTALRSSAVGSQHC
jgi:hypothetical protein